MTTVHLYADLKPGNRIQKLFEEFVSPALTEKGFKYSKSKESFIRKNEFFDNYVSWNKTRFNDGNNVVQFDVAVCIFSPKYRKWEKEFYNLEENWNNANAIDGGRVEYIEGWDKEYYDFWYDLVKYDNAAVMKKVLENILSAGQALFDKYISFDRAIKELKKHHVRNFETIVDLYIIQNKYKEALEFFNSHNEWHEEQIRTEGNTESQFSVNRRRPYELRKEKLNVR